MICIRTKSKRVKTTHALSFKEHGASSKKATNEMINGLRENDRQISDDKEMADVFNNYFVNIAAQLKETAEKSDFKRISEFVNSKVPINI